MTQVFIYSEKPREKKKKPTKEADLQKLVDGQTHDYITWLGSDSSSQNYETGVRVNVKIPGGVRWDTVKHPKSMSTWVKTSFARRRETEQWHLVASRVPMNRQTVLADVLDGDGGDGHMDFKKQMDPKIFVCVQEPECFLSDTAILLGGTHLSESGNLVEQNPRSQIPGWRNSDCTRTWRIIPVGK